MARIAAWHWLSSARAMGRWWTRGALLCLHRLRSRLPASVRVVHCIHLSAIMGVASLRACCPCCWVCGTHCLHGACMVARRPLPRASPRPVAADPCPAPPCLDDNRAICPQCVYFCMSLVIPAAFLSTYLPVPACICHVLLGTWSLGMCVLVALPCMAMAMKPGPADRPALRSSLPCLPC